MLDHVDLYLLPLAIFFIFCSTIGLIGNAVMIFCCAVTKRLRSPCHFLISLTCLIDAFHISGQYPFIYQFFTGYTSRQSGCYFILILPIVGYTAGGPLILAMGIDRFIAVKFPTTYRYYQQVLESVFRSILVTVSFVLLGWATTTIANSASYSVTDNLNTAHLIQTYAGITVNFAAASNVFVFYSINTEYREAINTLFGKHKKSGISHTETSTTQDFGTHNSKRSKSIRFRSPCHLLICATCVADLLHVCGQFPFCVHLFGNLTSSQAQCFYILSIPIVGFTTGGPLILSMGIDRLIAVKFPTK
ncbi:hypothetical protein L3Y34_008277 [Caenorhabditis briggsae]|uniref:G-protein coupled receptors family 1 profile domain-containing protein n=1 Tax=Caenorhabditis briggsae TaxID=6238 RepID=A0AAE9D0D8_CAEBR|nr:hypothetical protein L3Y34_008277 [Caenorhabditis briggsae]